MRAGALDRKIVIQERTAQKNAAHGTNSYSWATFAEAWAEVREMLPSRGERIAEGINIARRPIRVRMRYQNGVTSDMRVRYEGSTYRIVGGPSQLGRREGLEMVCELLSTEGDEA